MKLEKYEKNYLEKVVALSCKDISTVRDVLRSLLIAISIEFGAGNGKITIPYIGDLDIKILNIQKNLRIESSLNVDFTPSKIFKEELTCIFNNEEPPSTKWAELQVEPFLDDILNNIGKS